ncbi:stress response translation initiation inhibitor YciH [candidate division KSB1 bacterium]|nr:stress response translation initiation inhibitor YciH [candidate division KSB1 bacterium]
MCPECNKPVAECVCKKIKSAPSGDGIIRVQREVKGRKGKTVTIISGAGDVHDNLKKLATALKRSCGSGGSVKDGIIIIQGDQRDKIVSELQRRGFKVKKAGG